MAGRWWRAALAVLGVFTAIGLARCALWWAIDASYSPFANPRRLVHGMSRLWLWAAMTPLIVVLCRRLVWARGRTAWIVAAHTVAAVAAAFVDSWWFRWFLVELRPRVKLPPFESRFLIDLTGNVFFYLAIAAVAYAWQHRTALDARRLHALRLRTRQVQARLHVLDRQLQPHFVGNALNAVAELVHRDVARARRTLAALRALLMSPLTAAASVEVTLDEELGLLEAYLAIQRTRFGDRLTVTTSVDPAARPLFVPRFLLQPLVENAVRHGTSRRAAAGTIDVTAKVRDGNLVLVVRDDGPGLDGEPREGVGLGNTRQRLAALHGDAAALRLEQASGGGVEASVVLPARTAPRALDGALDGAAPPPLSPLPRRMPAALAFVAMWAALSVAWTGIGVLLNPFLATTVSFFDQLPGTAEDAAWFMASALLLVRAAQAWPIDGGRLRILLHVMLALTAVTLPTLMRQALAGRLHLPAFDDVFAVNLQTDLTACLVALAAAHAAVYLRRAHDRDLEAARLADELAASAVEARRRRIDPPALVAALDEIGELAGRDPEAADERIARLGATLRAEASP
jgi:hypothetical protein